ncbi:MAG: carboxypeptidase regulatory-like domain-containing protein [Planctomycetes bacterium]|nr:carboxypeptidase regulatory-like domain-containing protein [Planctomycetota bacterium]
MGTSVAVHTESMDVRFSRADVLKVSRRPDDGSEYPDLITLRGRDSAERGLVLETTPESVLVRFPRLASGGKVSLQEAKPAARAFFGILEGRVLVGKRPLKGCEVRLTLLERDTFLGVLTRVRRTDDERTLPTDADGTFAFQGLRPGPYRLAFRKQGSGPWLIRLREVPVDAVVEDTPVDVGDINLSKRILD